MSSLYLVDIYQKDFEEYIKQQNQRFIIELQEEMKNVKINQLDIIPIFINMSSQSNGIIDFRKTHNNNILN